MQRLKLSSRRVAVVTIGGGGGSISIYRKLNELEWTGLRILRACGSFCILSSRDSERCRARLGDKMRMKSSQHWPPGAASGAREWNTSLSSQRISISLKDPLPSLLSALTATPCTMAFRTVTDINKVTVKSESVASTIWIWGNGKERRDIHTCATG